MKRWDSSGDSAHFLNITNWTAKKNIKWLDSAIRRGDDILIVTDPFKHKEAVEAAGKWSAYVNSA